MWATIPLPLTVLAFCVKLFLARFTSSYILTLSSNKASVVKV